MWTNVFSRGSKTDNHQWGNCWMVEWWMLCPLYRLVCGYCRNALEAIASGLRRILQSAVESGLQRTMQSPVTWRCTCHLPPHGLNLEPLQLPPARGSGWRAGGRRSVLWENWQPRSADGWIFSGDCMSPILASLRIQKSAKILLGGACSLWLAVTFTRVAATFHKTCAWLHGPPPSPTAHVCWRPCLFGAVSQLSERLPPGRESSFGPT